LNRGEIAFGLQKVPRANGDNPNGSQTTSCSENWWHEQCDGMQQLILHGSLQDYQALCRQVTERMRCKRPDDDP
jgi:hypothetical protein